MNGTIARHCFPRLAGALLVLAIALTGATHSAAQALASVAAAAQGSAPVVSSVNGGAGRIVIGGAGNCTGGAAPCLSSTHTEVSVNSAVLAPDDNFPPGGALPVGWTTSIGADKGWAVAIDSTNPANSGTNSLKSALIFADQSAAIQVGGSFAAGTVSFAYHVSSELCCDFFEFYIDDAIQFSASGEVPWNEVFFPDLSAGVHVFKWVYIKDGSISAGSDAAWIDTVVLPSGTVHNLLNVTHAGGGGGTVTSTPAGVDCGITCEAYFAPGSVVTLTATPVAGSIFTGWTGACTTTPCVVTMSAAMSVSATFALADDNFPPGGVIPAGWVKTTGANASWVVASDSAYRGVYNLKSATILDSQSAAIQVTGTYPTGSISFAYHVSSEFDNDFFQFYIDGALQLAASDEVPWTPVCFPVTAGTRTFKWVYVKDSSEAFGADLAQIDSVILPAALAPGAPTAVTATAGNTQASVHFSAPACNGGGVTGYTVTSIPAGGIDSNSGTTVTTHLVTGLVNGTAYTFTVVAANAIGSGPASSASNSVTPAP